MYVRIGKAVHRAQPVAVDQWITARNVLPDAPPDSVQVRLALLDGRRVVLQLTPAEALQLAGQLSRLAG